LDPTREILAIVALLVAAVQERPEVVVGLMTLLICRMARVTARADVAVARLRVARVGAQPSTFL
jgi:hypothetical protein